MMPLSHRIVPPTAETSRRPARRRVAATILARLRATNSTTLAIGITSAFMLLSAAMSMAPDRPGPNPAADFGSLRLRGSLEAAN